MFGMPGTKPISSRTPETGIQALEMLTWRPIFSAMSCFEETRVTMIAVEIARRSDGICATRPSPTDSNTYVSAATPTGRSCCDRPMIRPPTILITRIKIEAMASPFTNFEAPSIAP